MSEQPKPLVTRLREASTGYDEWRVQDPKDGCYCIAFTWTEHLSPELGAREWLADHKARFPGGRYANYEVAKVRAKTQADALLEEAADEIERLRADAATFYMEYRMQCDEETKAWALRVEALQAHLRETEARYMALVKAIADNAFMLPSPMFVFGGEKNLDEAIDKARTA